MTLPDEFVFSTKIPIRIGDINFGGHLGHESFLVIMEEARERFLQSCGFSNADTIMADVSVMYLKQGCYGQTLEVEMAINDLSTKWFDMVYKVTDAETSLELARAKTTLIFYDYHKQSIIPVPQDFREKFSG
ncbi:acyl-CoA thioesterase [Chloroflexota bacterium]